jgi:hypothetical protein
MQAFLPVQASDAQPKQFSDRGARAFVWAAWIFMLLVDLFVLVKYGRAFPSGEDWYLVPALTGNDPNVLQSLWAQNNEHRVPFPRLILLILLIISGGDFRSGMIFNTLSLAALALAATLVARHIRGGRTHYVDAIFPITLLHLGHSENMFWSWQITQLVPSVLICVIFLVLVANRTFREPRAAVLAGVSLMLLPLGGANGLVFVPLISAWLALCGIRNWHVVAAPQRRWSDIFLVFAATVAVILTGLYFIGYQQPTWLPPHPGVGAAIEATFQFLGLGFGPIARNWWQALAAISFSLLVSSGVVGLLALARIGNEERLRALGMLIFLGNFVLYAIAIGWGRAPALPIFGGWPLRYVLFAAPALCIGFFMWELYGSPRVRGVVQWALLLLLIGLLPFNTVHAFNAMNWFVEQDKPLTYDLMMGEPAPVLAERHKTVLMHWSSTEELAGYMRMLRDKGMGPFAQMAGDVEQVLLSQSDDQNMGMQDDQVLPQQPAVGRDSFGAPVMQEIRYSLPQAREVYLVWGLNGWQQAAPEQQPLGTVLKDNLMHTPMLADGDSFVAKLPVLAGTGIDYGFLVTDQQGLGDFLYITWDGGYKIRAASASPVEVKGQLQLVTDLSDVLRQAPFFLAGVALFTGLCLIVFFFLGFFEPTTNFADAANRSWRQNTGFAITCMAVLGIAGSWWLVAQPKNTVTQELRYRFPEAGEVVLVWGINSWQPIPEGERPAGTFIESGLMHTPMRRQGETYIAQIRLPADTQINYGFQVLTTRAGLPLATPLWDGDYQRAATQNIVEEIAAIQIPSLQPPSQPQAAQASPATDASAAAPGTDSVEQAAPALPQPTFGQALVAHTFRYTSSEAGAVAFIWGVNGWQMLPAQLRPVGTVDDNQVMRTPMTREGSSFVITLQLPADTSVDYGFLVTETPSGAETKVWDSNRGEDYHTVVSGNGFSEVMATPGIVRRGTITVFDRALQLQLLLLLVMVIVLIIGTGWVYQRYAHFNTMTSWDAND